MSIFDDVLADDAAYFLDPDLMPGAESVTYTSGKTGVARQINAQVFRDPPAKVDGGGSVQSPVMGVYVSTHPTLGVAAPDSGGDSITLIYKAGQPARKFLIHTFKQVDAGMWHFELR